MYGNNLSTHDTLLIVASYSSNFIFGRVTASAYVRNDQYGNWYETTIFEGSLPAGESYSIADIATWPWLARHEWHDIGLKNYQNLSRWYSEIAVRDAVIKGYAFMDKGAVIPKP